MVRRYSKRASVELTVTVRRSQRVKLVRVLVALGFDDDAEHRMRALLQRHDQIGPQLGGAELGERWVSAPDSILASAKVGSSMPSGPCKSSGARRGSLRKSSTMPSWSQEAMARKATPKNAPAAPDSSVVNPLSTHQVRDNPQLVTTTRRPSACLPHSRAARAAATLITTGSERKRPLRTRARVGGRPRGRRRRR